MKQLTGLDASFLALETSNSTGHVGGVCVLDPSQAPAPLDLQALIELMGQRLPLVPILRKRLYEVPLGLDQPYWVDDVDFDLEYHIRELALPAPGSRAQLAEQVARLHARPLDRRRPLWEIYLITGLESGEIAIFSKVHHAAIDGVSGTELLTVLLDLEPEGRELPTFAEFRPEPLPHSSLLAARAMARLAWRPVQGVQLTRELVRAVPALAPVVGPVIGQVLGLERGDGQVIHTRAGRAPKTPFNRAISPHRRLAFLSVDLNEVKAVKNAFGASVNDVVMAMCAGALRRWLIEHSALPETPLISMIPVSVRTEAQRGRLGNQVSAMLATLPTDVADPLERLRVVKEVTEVAKANQAGLPDGLVDNITGFAPPALSARAARVVFATGLLHRLPAFNVCISNVPGPNVPVYLGGAKLVAQYPTSVITDGQGLNITLVGYNGQLHFGLIACRQLVPDVERIAEFLGDELASLLKLLPES